VSPHNLGYERLIGRKFRLGKRGRVAVGAVSKIRSLVVAVLSCAVGAFAAGAAPVGDEPFRAIDPQNLVLLDTKYGEAVVELAPRFAPKHVERLRTLIRAHFYDGKSFYRVVDGFVALSVRPIFLRRTWVTSTAFLSRAIARTAGNG
jgi:hypothetical protein